MPLEPFMEPLLTPNQNRLVMFPIQHTDVWDLYKKAVDSFWKAEDIDLSRDYADWIKMTADEQHFIKIVLAFFAASDGIIIENLVSRFMVEIQSSEIRAFYAFQNSIENVHSETYSLLIDTYIKDSGEKNRMFNAIENFPCIQKKVNWALNSLFFSAESLMYVSISKLYVSEWTFSIKFWKA